MVTDKVNQIYTDLMEYLESIYPNIKGSQKYADKAPSYPYVYMYQIDGSTQEVTLSNTEEAVNLAFQIEVYSNKGDTITRKISTDIKNYMMTVEGFKCRTFLPAQNNGNISRFVSRYDRLDV